MVVVARSVYPLPVVLVLLYVVGGIASGFAGDLFAALGGVAILGAGALAYEVFRRSRAAGANAAT